MSAIKIPGEDIEYKAVEISPVDDHLMTRTLNECAEEGFRLDRVEFVQQPGVRRPVMAFLFLWREKVPAKTEAPE